MCFPLHLLVIFVTGTSLHCLEGNSLECSIRLSATHHPSCSELHPSLPDGVHGPFLYLLKEFKRVVPAASLTAPIFFVTAGLYSNEALRFLIKTKRHGAAFSFDKVVFRLFK